MRWLVIALAVIFFGSCSSLIVVQNVLSDLDSVREHGKFAIPSSHVVELPAGRLEIFVSQFNDRFEVPPHVTVSVTAVDAGKSAPTVTRAAGEQFGTQRKYGTDHRFARVWTVLIARPGKYRVTAAGVDASEAYELCLGHGPPIDAMTVWMFAAIAAAGCVVLWSLSRVVVRMRSGRAAT